MTIVISAETPGGEVESQNTLKPNTLIKGKRIDILRLNLVTTHKVGFKC